MLNELYVGYDILKHKLQHQEAMMVYNPTQTYEHGAYEVLSRILTRDILNINKPFTQPFYLYGNYPIKVEDAKVFYDSLEIDFENLFKTLSQFQTYLGQVVLDTNQRYLYRGTKYLNQVFRSDYDQAKFGQTMLQFDIFQNGEKNVLDEVFFVERSLGFMTKKISGMRYYTPEVLEVMPSTKQVFDTSYYPDGSQDFYFEIFVKLPARELINFLYLDLEFAGVQFIENIEYLQSSIDGVTYYNTNKALLSYVNECFKSIYDQNSFKGFIPLVGSYMRYIKIGIKKKVSVDGQITINKVLPISAEFDTDYQKAAVPVMFNLPYVAKADASSEAFVPFEFNYSNIFLVFEKNNSVSINFEMSYDTKSMAGSPTQVTQTEWEFGKTHYTYYSPILFNYSIFIGL